MSFKHLANFLFRGFIYHDQVFGEKKMISNINDNCSPNFKAIQLPAKEAERAQNCINRLLDTSISEIEKRRLKNNIYDIFNPHLQSEAKYKSAYNAFEEVLSEIYLNFSEILNNIKEYPLVENFLDKLNDFIPKRYTPKANNLVLSLDAAIPSKFSCAKKSDFITEEDLPIPRSASLREKKRKKLDNEIKSANLSGVTKTRLEKRANNMKFSDIAKEENVNKKTVFESVRRGLLKIQNNNENISEKYRERIKILAGLLGCEEKELTESILLFTCILSRNPETIAQNLNKTAELLKLPPKAIVDAALKHPTLFGMSPETIANNVKKSAELLNYSEEQFVQMALKLPQLFCQKPETLKENFCKSAELLKCSEEDFTQAALKQSSFLTRTPESLLKNVQEAAKLLGCTEKEFTAIGLKIPTLLCMKPESIMQNVKQSSHNLDCDEKTFIKAAMKDPCLFYTKPETIMQNVRESAKLLGCTEKEFIKAGFRKTTLFIMKPETVLSNVQNSCRLLNCSEKDFIFAALRQPNLICAKPETLKNNVETTSGYLNCSIEDYVKSALKHGALFYQKPETLKNNAEKTAQLLRISVDDFVKIALKHPTLFTQKPETIYSNISGSANVLDMTNEEFIKANANRPACFSQKPETIKKKLQIANYYQKIKNEPPVKFLYQKSDETMYSLILAHLIQQSGIEGMKEWVKVKKSFRLEPFLKANKNRKFCFEIPQDEVAKDFVNYVQGTSIKTIGKNIFEFKIKGENH